MYERAFNSGFEDRDIRRRFIIKVYSLLLIQLMICITIIIVSIFIPPIRDYLRDDWIISICFGILGFILFIILSCVRVVRLHVPTNYILLTLMSLCIGLMLGSISAKSKTLIVIASLGMTIAIVVLLTLLAALPCFDITGWIIYIVVISMVLMLVAFVILILAFVFQMPILFMVYAGILALIYSVFIVFDTQMIMGGRKYEISPEEYVLGTVTLFIDIIGLYMMILSIMSCATN